MTYGDRNEADEIADAILEMRGKPARYHPYDGTAPFDLIVSFNPGAGMSSDVEQEDLADVIPRAAGTRFDLATAVSEDRIEVVGRTWIVRKAAPDGGGFVILDLSGPVD